LSPTGSLSPRVGELRGTQRCGGNPRQRPPPRPGNRSRGAEIAARGPEAASGADTRQGGVAGRGEGRQGVGRQLGDGLDAPHPGPRRRERGCKGRRRARSSCHCGRAAWPAAAAGTPRATQPARPAPGRGARWRRDSHKLPPGPGAGPGPGPRRRPPFRRGHCSPRASYLAAPAVPAAPGPRLRAPGSGLRVGGGRGRGGSGLSLRRRAGY
jgi:23S rRNA pseudouridine2605 synthase